MRLLRLKPKTNQKNKQVYSENGNYVGEEFVGYELTQSIKIESKDVLGL